MDSITPRQRELLDYLQETVNREQRFPTYRQMASAMQVSAVGTIQDLLQALIEEGYIEKSGRKLRLAQARQAPAVSVPILGEVAAGALQDAYEVALGSLTLNPELLPKNIRAKDLFALRVRGESMRDAGILDGDYAVVLKSQNFRNGDFVVVHVEGEATLKELELPSAKNNRKLRLIPHNESMQPMELDPSEKTQILGKLITIQRFW